MDAVVQRPVLNGKESERSPIAIRVRYPVHYTLVMTQERVVASVTVPASILLSLSPCLPDYRPSTSYCF